MLKCYTLSAIKTTQQFCMNSSKYHKKQQSYVCIFFQHQFRMQQSDDVLFFMTRIKFVEIFFSLIHRKNIFSFSGKIPETKKKHTDEKNLVEIFSIQKFVVEFIKKKNATTNPKLHQNNMSTTYGANVGFSSLNLVRRIYEYLTCNISKLLETEGTEGWTD